LYVRCPRSWYAKYVEGLKEEVGDAARLGKVIHKVMELSTRGEDPKTTLAKTWAEEGPGELSSLKDANEMIKWLLEDVIVPERVLRDNEGTPYVEHWFEYQLTPNILVRGIIDRVEIDNIGLEVIDFKTGFTQYSTAGLHYDPQAVFYCAQAKVISEEAHIDPGTVRVSFALARSKSYITITPTEEELETSLEFFKNLVESWPEPDEGPEAFPECLNSYCGGCPIRLTCTTYQAVTETIPTDEIPETVEELFNLISTLRIIQKIAGNKEAEARRVLEEKIKPGETVKAGAYQGSFSKSYTSVVNAIALLKLATPEELEALTPALSVAVTKLRPILKKLDRASEFEELVLKVEGTPRLTISKIGEQ